MTPLGPGLHGDLRSRVLSCCSSARPQPDVAEHRSTLSPASPPGGRGGGARLPRRLGARRPAGGAASRRRPPPGGERHGVRLLALLGGRLRATRRRRMPGARQGGARACSHGPRPATRRRSRRGCGDRRPQPVALPRLRRAPSPPRPPPCWPPPLQPGGSWRRRRSPARWRSPPCRGSWASRGAGAARSPASSWCRRCSPNGRWGIGPPLPATARVSSGGVCCSTTTDPRRSAR